MAFDKDKLILGVHTKGLRPYLFKYCTSDDLASVKANTSYFKDAYDMLEPCDIIEVYTDINLTTPTTIKYIRVYIKSVDFNAKGVVFEEVALT